MAQMYTEKGVLFAVSTALAELLGWQKKKKKKSIHVFLEHLTEKPE